ncbi:MAG: valine--tRNA ligase, partial [Chloroflexi bacterium]|nr:valine--tRNA ligase [Chloroflexota bacterium]
TADLSAHLPTIETLARARPVTVMGMARRQAPGKDTLALVLSRAEVFLPLAGVVDVAAERGRLSTEAAETRSFIGMVEARLSDQAFLERAPATVVDKEREKLSAAQDRLKRLEELLARLG